MVVLEGHWNVSDGLCYAKELYSVGTGEDQRAVSGGMRDSVEEGAEREETRGMESLDFSLSIPTSNSPPTFIY